MGFVTKVWNSPDNNPKGIQPTVVLRYKSEKKMFMVFHYYPRIVSQKTSFSLLPSKTFDFFVFLTHLMAKSNGAEPLYWVVVKYVLNTIFI